MEKKYVWTFKQKEGKYGDYFTFSFRKDDIVWYENEKWYVSFIISPRKEVGKYGETHTASVMPPLNGDAPTKYSSIKQKPQESTTNLDIKDIPF